MDSKELQGLMEAYAEICASHEEIDEATAMAKRGYDEAPIRQKIAKSTGGGAAADRATKLADKSTFGDAKKAKQRQDLARKQRGDFRKTTSSSPGLHGYAHKSDDPAVKAKQAARGAQRGVLTPAEKKQFNREEFDIFETVLEFLCVEGFAETLEEAEWMMANLIDEEAISIILGEEQLQELSDRKLRAYIKKSEKSHKEINKKWDEGTATEKEKLKSIGHEEGQRRAYKKLDTREEFENWVDSLLEEGYDLSEYTWEEMFDIYEAEGSYGETPKAYAAASKTKMTAKRKPFLKAMQRRTNPANRKDAYDSPRKGMTASDREEARAGAAHGSPRGHDYPSQGPGGVTKNPKKLRKQKAMGEFAKEAFEAWLDEAMTNYEKNRKRAAQRAAARNEARAQGKTGAVPGVGYVTPRKERETWTDESGKTRHAKGL